VEHHPVLLVEAAHEVAGLRAQHARERPLVRRDHVDLDLARPQRGRHLQADEARPQHDGPPRAVRGGHDRPAVRERS
jgi:hypothetical protein